MLGQKHTGKGTYREVDNRLDGLVLSLYEVIILQDKTQEFNPFY